MKSSNILLDENFEAHLSDFGIAKCVSIAKSHASTYVLGTIGYIDPEYARTSRLTEKSDVYSFGIVLLELLTGKKAVDNDSNLHQMVKYSSTPFTFSVKNATLKLHYLGREMLHLHCLISHPDLTNIDMGKPTLFCVLVYQILSKADDNTLMEAVDPEVSVTCIDQTHVKKMFQLALLCTKAHPSERPTMHEVGRVLISLLPPPPIKDCLAPPPPKSIDYAQFVIGKGQPQLAMMQQQPQTDNNSSDAQWLVRFREALSKNTL